MRFSSGVAPETRRLSKIRLIAILLITTKVSPATSRAKMN
jgi:hypothetical protein